jgi:hypothetical protein
MDDDNAEHGRHHALDVYRINGMLTQEEDDAVRRLSQEYASHPVVVDAREIAAAHFVARDGVGRLRVREHALYQASFQLDRFAVELERLLASR